MNILDKLAAHAKERCDEAKEYISLEELKKLKELKEANR